MTSRTTPSPGAVPRVQPHHADDPHALRPLLDRIGRFMLGNTTKCPTGRWAASWVVVLPPTDHWTRSGPVVLSSDFWNRPLQNWRSEFLAVGSMVVLSITCGNADHRNPNPSEPPTPPPASKAEHTRLPPTVPRTGFRSRARRGGVSLTAAAGSGPEHHRNPRRPERHGSCLPFAVSDTVTVSPGLHGRHHRPASQGRRLVTQRAPFPAEPDPRHHPPRPQILCRTRGSTRQRWCDRASSGVPDTATDRAADKER